LNKTYEIKVIRQSINLDKLSLIRSGYQTISKVNIVAIGRLVEKKGFQVLINAIARCSVEIQSKIMLKIYGDGPLMNHLLNQISKNNLKSSIELMGMFEHTPLMKALAEADILVVPSIELVNDIDGVPTVIAEAMAVKTPVIATPIAGINEMIVDQKTGFIVSENNADELSNKLEFLVENESERNKVVNEAFSKVSKEYRLTLAEEIDNY
jgi:colanic acid/amylovoran biosynthesis glycosyltransferase